MTVLLRPGNPIWALGVVSASLLHPSRAGIKCGPGALSSSRLSSLLLPRPGAVTHSDPKLGTAGWFSRHKHPTPGTRASGLCRGNGCSPHGLGRPWHGWGLPAH